MNILSAEDKVERMCRHVPGNRAHGHSDWTLSPALGHRTVSTPTHGEYLPSVPQSMVT